jgi:hypothetical protein
LDLPAVVGGAVVGEDDLPVRHEDALDGITRRPRVGLGGLKSMLRRQGTQSQMAHFIE